MVKTTENLPSYVFKWENYISVYMKIYASIWKYICCTSRNNHSSYPIYPCFIAPTYQTMV